MTVRKQTCAKPGHVRTGDLLDQPLDPPGRICRLQLRVADHIVLVGAIVISNEPGVRRTYDIHVLVNRDWKIERQRKFRTIREVTAAHSHSRSPSSHVSNHSFRPRITLLMPSHPLGLLSPSAASLSADVPLISKLSSRRALSKASDS